MTPSPRVQRALSKIAAIGILAGLVWIGVSAIIIPLAARLSDAEDDIAQERLLLSRLLDEAHALAEPRAAGDTNLDAFLAGKTEAERTAALHAHVETLAASSGVRLTSLQPTGQRASAPLNIIGLRAVAAGSTEALQRFLHGLEAGTPAVIIEAIDIASSSLSHDDASGALDMRLTISGAASPAAEASP
jgi:hypothetical protein